LTCRAISKKKGKEEVARPVHTRDREGCSGGNEMGRPDWQKRKSAEGGYSGREKKERKSVALVSVEGGRRPMVI